jgi:hypothetical protein
VNSGTGPPCDGGRRCQLKHGVPPTSLAGQSKLEAREAAPGGVVGGAEAVDDLAG